MDVATRLTSALRTFTADSPTSRSWTSAQRARLKSGECSLVEWASYYLPDLAYLEPGEIHRRIVASFGNGDSLRAAAMASRGSAKSTLIGVANTLRLAALGRKRFIVYVSPEAEAHLARILNQVVENDRLLFDYPHLRPQDHRRLKIMRKRKRKETQAEFTTEGGVTFIAKTPGSAIRGMVRDAHRPDHLVLDDIENKDTAANPDRTRKLIKWVKEDLMGLAGPGNEAMSIHAIGTPLAHFTMIGTLVDEWSGGVIPIHDALTGENLWPEGLPDEELDRRRYGFWAVFDVDLLRELRYAHDTPSEQLPEGVKFVAGMGDRAYHQEYEMKPIEDGAADFQRHWFDDRFIDADDVNPADFVQTVRSWDFAATEKAAKSPDPDWTACVKMGVDKRGRVVILHAWQDRLTPHAVEQRAQSFAREDGQRVRITIPQDPGQAGKSQVFNWVVKVLRGYHATAVIPSGDKRVRWSGLSAQAEVGNVWIVRAPWNSTWLDHMCQLPFGAHDDIGDASADAFNFLNPGEPIWSAMEAFPS
ncbi:MAG: phage terminase large subunit [Trueperaceae bacterium]|nr:phage terminase large subunit [Trueperaceae bacterium]